MIDRPKSIGQAWRLLIQMKERIDEKEDDIEILIKENKRLRKRIWQLMDAERKKND